MSSMNAPSSAKSLSEPHSLRSTMSEGPNIIFPTSSYSRHNASGADRMSLNSRIPETSPGTGFIASARRRLYPVRRRHPRPPTTKQESAPSPLRREQRRFTTHDEDMKEYMTEYMKEYTEMGRKISENNQYILSMLQELLKQGKERMKALGLEG